MQTEKLIGCLFGLAAIGNVYSLFASLILGQPGFALLYLLLAGYFAFRSKQLLSE